MKARWLLEHQREWLPLLRERGLWAVWDQHRTKPETVMRWLWEHGYTDVMKAESRRVKPGGYAGEMSRLRRVNDEMPAVRD